MWTFKELLSVLDFPVGIKEEIVENKNDKWLVQMEIFLKARFHFDCAAIPEKSHFGLCFSPGT